MTDKLWSFKVAQTHFPDNFTRDDCLRWIKAMTQAQVEPEELSDEQVLETAERARDEQEALSVRWSSATLLVTPLASGRFAVFDRACQLLDIVDELDPEQLKLWSRERNDELRQRAILASMSGEPSDRQLARDLTVGRSGPPRDPKPRRTGPAGPDLSKAIDL